MNLKSLKNEYKFPKQKRKDVARMKGQHLSRLEDIREQDAGKVKVLSDRTRVSCLPGGFSSTEPPEKPPLRHSD